MKKPLIWRTTTAVWSLIGGVLLFGFICNSSTNEKQVFRKLESLEYDGSTNRTWKLPEWGSQAWCNPPILQPLHFELCDQTKPVNIIPFIGGLTNALKIIIIGAIKSLEENRCFTIDETTGHLYRRKRKEDQFGSFIQRYFEPIGLPYDHAIVKKAFRNNNTYRFDIIKDLLTDSYARRIHDINYTIPAIYTTPLDGHVMKKVAIQRLWRPLPKWRVEVCEALEKQGLSDDFIAFSVRRGDKRIEHFHYQSLDTYIKQAEKDIDKIFGGVPPKIFVATDDCSVLADFRSIRPTWTFVSECYPNEHQHGFKLEDTQMWTQEHTDKHFSKFFKELYALAMSRVFIGVGYSNVAWFSYFMRPDRHSFRLVDQNDISNVDMW
mmetsp:Transcript_33779/g.48020  ORF Transcript_33779/g.48020 Transcript_33779/m.48020 type:complete len:378 (+) Transcript_33779:75-1208(+)|eukprot:CAMPEP_0202449462 /NCGR_PEP_ID=MMETSP1360-20130828/8192_1 /ASSEMBLY_ACC=CAM_ASM_000848 /TAXON_ID=515479 /ORGANISM="Licmophora paradoxa, Strain CCMP2313" /LENGTH=377 /DNA_ID=CAMNT_0049067397 /DNA_START=66 /DNA_END=1199 /DNA_ORIENTATION=+